MIAQSDWRWFGLAGHFICGRWCRFHLCTLVGRVIVSTVGFYVPPHESGGSERTEADYLARNPNGCEIGYKRHYETMVFKAGEPCAAEGCACGQPIIVPSELDMRGYETVGDANEGHMELCLKWASESLQSDIGNSRDALGYCGCEDTEATPGNVCPECGMLVE